jgi:hypothetical protein
MIRHKARSTAAVSYLSDGRLAEFCLFFLAACLDQVRFMQALLAPETLTARMREFVAAEAAGGGWICA